VCSKAEVSGNAWVRGEARATKEVITSNAHKHYITLTDNYIAIGCENYSIKFWLENINEIAEKHGYNKKELKALKVLLNGMLLGRRLNETK
jgi:hypothetical protein